MTCADYYFSKPANRMTKTSYHLGGVKNVHSGLTYLKHYWTFVAGGRLNTVYD